MNIRLFLIVVKRKSLMSTLILIANSANFQIKIFEYFDLLTIEYAKFAKCIWYKIFDFFYIDNFIEICDDVTIFRMNQTTMSSFQIDNRFNKRENVCFWHEYRKNNNFRDNENRIYRVLNDTQYEKIVN